MNQTADVWVECGGKQSKCGLNKDSCCTALAYGFNLRLDQLNATTRVYVATHKLLFGQTAH